MGHAHVAQTKLRQAIFLALLILGVELFGGLWANSLALLSDAGHMLTDVISLVVAWWAIRVATKSPSPMMTYGYHRITILAALFNALTLVGIAFFIGGEAYRRILHPEPVQGLILFVTATIGILVNLYIGLGMRDQSDNINIKSAMLHVFGDAAASAGVIIAGLVMYFAHWYIADPIMSILIALLVAIGAWRIVKETYVVLMEGTPSGILFTDVEEFLNSIPEVINLHDLHIWSLTSNRHALSGHLVVDGDMCINESQAMVESIEATLSERFGIGHVTLQLESRNHHHANETCCVESNWHHDNCQH
ncbi:MAG: cation diffusion facilitator family transporter [Peptococcaceae bacterium]|nr:cation diffusion facilitator family transporter [Peptococcaceae bacterium]